MSEIESRIETGDIKSPEATGDIKSPEATGDANGLRGGTEKLRVLPVNEDSRKITQTLSNETSLKILELLGKKNLSASDIAGELKIPLTTVKYNIDSLVESELVQVKQIKWSRKGRQVKIYEAMEKLIVLVPSKGFADKVSIISMLQQYIGVIMGAFFAAAGIEYLTAYLRTRRLINALPWGAPPAGLPEAVDYVPSPEFAPAPAALVANNASEGGQGGLSPKTMESTEFASYYYSIDEGVIPEKEGLNDVFAGVVEEEVAEETSAEAMVAQEAPMDGDVAEAAPVGDAVREQVAEDASLEETSMNDVLVEENSIDEVPMENEMPAEEAPEAPEIEGSAPVSAEDSVPSEGVDLPEGMDSSALDSVPPGTLGASTGHHFFDTLLAHPGIWFLFGCLFVICLLIVREVYYKKKSM